MLIIAPNSFENRGRVSELSPGILLEGEKIMRFAVTIFLGLAAAGAAAAAPQATDVDYLKASRCKGIAEGLGTGVDTTRIDAFLKRESAARLQTIVEQGEAEQLRARREARQPDRQPRLTAELQGACAGYLGGGQMAGQHAQPSS
jgi:hypothetical protein